VGYSIPKNTQLLTKFSDLPTVFICESLDVYRQIWDDYMNLKNIEVCARSWYYLSDERLMFTLQDTEREGFRNDIAERRFSFPFTHAIHHPNTQGKSMLPAWMEGEDERKLILEDLDRLGSLQYTEKVLRVLFREIEEGLMVLERRSRITNWIFRLLLQALKLPPD
jgi:hypothetical protein